MMHFGSMRLVVATFVALVVAIPAAGQNLLQNPGFEELDPLLLTETRTAGQWMADLTSRTGSENGIVPPESQTMLRFLSTSVNPQPSSLLGCNVAQMVDLTPVAGLVAGGAAEAQFSVHFNRVAGDSQTDTAFSIRIIAQEGPLNDLTGLANTGWMTFLSDGDPATWESFSVSLMIPSNADWLQAEIMAEENIFNDTTTGPEFDGHYVDDTALYVVPEPATLALLSLGGLALLRRKRQSARTRTSITRAVAHGFPPVFMRGR